MVTMDSNLNQIKTQIYTSCAFELSDLELELESKDYAACRFNLSGRRILSRTAKITPKKVGQFVTFWKRSPKGPITPFEASDPIDFYAVNVRTEQAFGQFVFPKSVLIQKGILSTTKKEGKRGFRVYPTWDLATSQQAKRTQQWQLDYFYTINDSTDLQNVIQLYAEGYSTT